MHAGYDVLRYTSYPTAADFSPGERDRQRARIIERLMCDFAVDLKAIAPHADFSHELSALGPLQSDGIVELSGTKVIVTEGGRAVVRVVAAVFDGYRRAQAAQFSKAI